MRSIALSTVLIFLASLGFAGKIGQETARRVAQNFLTSRTPLEQRVVLSCTDIRTLTLGATPVCYVAFFEPSGWVVVSASNAAVPVLAYSFGNNWTDDQPPAGFTLWMNHYQKVIQKLINEEVEPAPAIQYKWQKLIDGMERDADAPDSHRSVEPLITSDWNQSPYYNEYCPADPAGPGGHAVAGCVPVCMAQVMYYYRWPDTGTGSYSYTDPTYGVLSADFGATTYRWNEMKNIINSSNPAIAELIYHLGVSCDLQYGPDGSGMYNHKAAYALRTHFKYSPETQYLYRDSTTLNWDSVLIAHLDRKMPMYYAGWDVPNISGHAFVCDGYQDSSFFHFNFGWGGSNNGYFYTSDLTPGPYNFQLAQEVIINCYPDTLNYTYPTYCQGPDTLVSLNGSVEDGSGPVKPYLPGSACSWLIDPQSEKDSVTSITLSFSRFDLGPDDLLNLYDGPSASSTLLGSYTGNSIPASITTAGNKMLITLTSASGNVGKGFLADYKTTIPVWCSGTSTITADTLELTDGSFGFDYHNGTNCRWKLQTSDGSPLTIHFRSFDTEPGKDLLRFFDFGTGDTLAILSGSYDPGSLPDSVTAPTGKMFINFTTNSSVTASGWELYYPKSHVGMADGALESALHLYPNPAREWVTVEMGTAIPANAILRILSADGRVIITRSTGTETGTRKLSFDLSALAPGIYLVELSSGAALVRTRLVVN